VVSIKSHKDTLQINAADQVTSLDKLRYAYKRDGELVSLNGPHLPLTKALKGASSIAAEMSPITAPEAPMIAMFLCKTNV